MVAFETRSQSSAFLLSELQVGRHKVRLLCAWNAPPHYWPYCATWPHSTGASATLKFLTTAALFQVGDMFASCASRRPHCNLRPSSGGSGRSEKERETCVSRPTGGGGGGLFLVWPALLGSVARGGRRWPRARTCVCARAPTSDSNGADNCC